MIAELSRNRRSKEQRSNLGILMWNPKVKTGDIVEHTHPDLILHVFNVRLLARLHATDLSKTAGSRRLLQCSENVVKYLHTLKFKNALSVVTKHRLLCA